MPFSMADIVNDAAFSQNFQLIRSSGYWQLGKWVRTTKTMNMWGSIQPTKGTDLEQVPEADRVVGMLTIHITEPIYETNTDITNATSDVVIWHGQQYRIVGIPEWNDYGYLKAFAVRMSGQ